MSGLHGGNQTSVTLRQYFAIRILAARLVAHPKRDGVSTEAYYQHQCSIAYQLADLMLEEDRK